MRHKELCQSLNIKNPEARRLAQAIADLTGDSITHAVIEALRKHYERLQAGNRNASVEEMLSIADRVAAHVQRPYADHAELLYDEHGLPK